MLQFKNKEDGFKEIKKAILIKSIPISLLAIIGGLAINHFNTNIQQSNVNVYPFILPILLGAMTFRLYRSINRQKIIFSSYRLTINENSITREQHNTPTITISNSEISEIIKNSNGSFTIKGNSMFNVIGVSFQIEDYELLEKSLSEIREITIKDGKKYLQMLLSIGSILVIGLMLAVYISNDKIVVGVSGTILLIVLGYSFFQLFRSKNIDSKTKKSIWWIILPTASIIGVMYFKLTGQ